MAAQPAGAPGTGASGSAPQPQKGQGRPCPAGRDAGFRAAGGKRIKNTNIIDLANLISNAQTVVTSCNDAIKLAVVFDKNLHIFDVQDDEQIELIDKLNLKKRIVKDTSRVLEPWQEYKDIKEKMEDLKTDSYELLQ